MCDSNLEGSTARWENLAGLADGRLWVTSGRSIEWSLRAFQAPSLAIQPVVIDREN